MFYVNFINLCAKNDITPSHVAKEIGTSRAAISKWKNGGMPSDVTLAKLADFFSVTVNELLADEEIVENEKTSTDTMSADDELAIYLEELKNRKEMRMLFKLASGATKEDVEKAVAIIEALSR